MQTVKEKGQVYKMSAYKNKLKKAKEVEWFSAFGEVMPSDGEPAKSLLDSAKDGTYPYDSSTKNSKKEKERQQKNRAVLRHYEIKPRKWKKN